jgi:Na+-driven multidrug efflux pump
VDETATGSANFFWSSPLCRAADLASTTIAAMHPPRPPSIDQGVIAVLWAVGLAVFIYFGLLAVGASGATAIVLALVSFAAIWLLVRLRGEEAPARRRRRP